MQIYGIPPSAPCRVVYLTCHVLGLDYEVITLDPRIGEHKKPEFLKVPKFSHFLFYFAWFAYA